MNEPFPAPSSKSPWLKNLRRLLLFGLSIYVAIVVMLAVLQRALQNG